MSRHIFPTRTGGPPPEPVQAAGGSRVYRVQRVSVGARLAKICLQNDAGPSALLAVTNALLLSGALSIPVGTARVCDLQLVTILTAHMVKCNSERLHGRDAGTKEALLRSQATLADAIAALPTLSDGLDVDCRFDAIDSFEASQALSVFDLCRTRLVHGWLVDPSDRLLHAAVAHRSCNELTDIVITADSDEASAAKQPAADPVPPAGCVLDGAGAGQAGDADLVSEVIAESEAGRAGPPPAGLAAPPSRVGRTLRVPESHMSYHQPSTVADESSSEDTAEALRVVRDMNGAAGVPSAESGALRHNRMRQSTGDRAVHRAGPRRTDAPPPIRLGRRRSLSRPRAGGGSSAATNMSRVLNGVVEVLRSLPLVPRSGVQQPPGGPRAAASSQEAVPPVSATSDSGSPGARLRPARAEGERAGHGPGETRIVELARTWLPQHPSRMSDEGLRRLQAGLAAGETAVLVCGDHFSTVIKAEVDGNVYALVSDAGAGGCPSAVFEMLQSGDSARPLHVRGSALHIGGAQRRQTAGGGAAARVRDAQNTADELLAARLQADEVRAVKDEVGRRRRRQQTHPVPDGRWNESLEPRAPPPASTFAPHAPRSPAAPPLSRPSAAAPTQNSSPPVGPRRPGNRLSRAPSHHASQHPGSRAEQPERLPAPKWFGPPRLDGESFRPKYRRAARGADGLGLRGRAAKALSHVQTTPLRQDFWGERARR
jgi:hypothetical protein